MTATDTLERRAAKAKTEHFAVPIVWAGISGVGAASHLPEQFQNQSLVAPSIAASAPGFDRST